MKHKILIPETVRCMDCNLKLKPHRFPDMKFSCLLPTIVTEENREAILKDLGLAIASFADYAYLAYHLDARSVDMKINFDAVILSATEES